MKTIGKKVTTVALLVALAPGLALAHDGNGKGNEKRGDLGGRFGMSAFFEDHGRGFGDFLRGRGNDDHGNMRVTVGSISAIRANGFDVKTKDNTTVSITTNSSTVLRATMGTTLTMSDLRVGDNVWVRSSSSDPLTASLVVATPANTHPAAARGTVTAVNGNAVTVQMNNHGVVSNATVKLSSDTEVKKVGDNASISDGTAADVKVGTTVKVKGLWDELLNVLNAFKVWVK